MTDVKDYSLTAYEFRLLICSINFWLECHLPYCDSEHTEYELLRLRDKLEVQDQLQVYRSL